ncbi:MAG TPA: helix-turn-helix domain-containing protein [Ktedonobacterales bacterium]
MDDLPEVYNLESIEQVRGIADELRLRVGNVLISQPMTVTQLGALLNEPPAKIHYHVRELERLGVVKLVETREKGGILEKYYRAVAKNIIVPPALLRQVSPDETVSTANEYLQIIAQGFLRALNAAVRSHRLEGPEVLPLGMAATQVWMTGEDMKRVSEQLRQLLEPYAIARGTAEEHEITFAQIVFPMRVAEPGPTGAAAAEASRPSAVLGPTTVPAVAAGPVGPPTIHSRVTVGATSFGRADLEQVIARGEQLAITVYGYCTFSTEVTPDLIERAIASIRCIGVLNAAPAVREALKRKEVAADG